MTVEEIVGFKTSFRVGEINSLTTINKPKLYLISHFCECSRAVDSPPKGMCTTLGQDLAWSTAHASSSKLLIRESLPEYMFFLSHHRWEWSPAGENELPSITPVLPVLSFIPTSRKAASKLVSK